MRISNPFKMNDWEFSKFLKTILFIQVAVLFLLVLDSLGLYIPILLQVVSLVFLLFVPGVLVLRILRVHDISSAEVLLYSVGLSIASIMVIGFFISLIYPLIGILNPMSLLPLTVTVSVFVMFLAYISYLRDKDFVNTHYIDFNDFSSPYLLFLFLIPLLVVIGTYLMNTYKNNILILISLFLISSVVLLFAFNKIKSRFYPLTIFILSISLLFQTSLISNYITGWDIQTEYYLANSVLQNSVWYLNLQNVINTTLSITILAPILAIFTKMNLDMVFKIVYPLIFALVPIGLYVVIKKQAGAKIAFLSSFFFISFYVFYTEMLALGRQEIAELFLVLLILIMVSSKISNLNRSLFFIIFGVSLIISHYSLSYIYMFSLLIVYLLVMLSERYDFNSLVYNRKLVRKKGDQKYQILSLSFVLFFMIAAVTWYTFISSSASLIVFLNLGNTIANSFVSEFLSPTSVQSLTIIQQQSTFLHSLFRYLTYFTQFLIVIGVFSLLFKDKLKFKKEYLAFILVNVLILVASFMVPYFSSALNTERLYQITLIFLAPACVIGGLTLLKFINNFIQEHKLYSIKNFSNKFVIILSVFFMVLLLFNSGVVFSLASDNSTSISLNSTYYTANYNGMEIQSVNWLYNYGLGVGFTQNPHFGIVLADENQIPLITKFGLHSAPYSFYYNKNFSTMDSEIRSNQSISNYYFYLGTNNILTNSYLTFSYTKSSVLGTIVYGNPAQFNDVNNNLSRIYDSNGAQVFYES